MTTKQVARATEQSVAIPTVLDDSLLEVGTGLEDTASTDYAIPFLQILQAGSPQIKKSDGKYIQGAEEGDIYNTVSSDLVKSDVGIIVVPCYYQKKYIEWKPRDAGGGLIQVHTDREILSKCTRNEKNAFVLENGNYIAETAQFYVLITNEQEDTWSQAVVAMTSTQLSKSRKWLSQMRQRMVKNSKGESVNAPTFLFKYNLKTVPEKNDQGSWFGWNIGLNSQIKNLKLLEESATFLKLIKAGEVEVKEQSEETVDSDQAPF